MEKRSLFGGSTSISLPPHFIDLSDLRQVPDNQEVFVEMEGDGSVIIELLEVPTGNDFEIGVRYHVEQLLEENRDALSNLTIFKPDFHIPLTSDDSVFIEAARYRLEAELENMVILLRFPSRKLDILINFNRLSDFSDVVDLVMNSFTIYDFGILL